MNKFTLYHFSPRSLEFVEARWCKTKLTLLSIALFAVIVGIGIEASRLCGDILGLELRRESALKAENARLQERMRVFTSGIRSLQTKIGLLSEGGDELRLNVDLPKVNAETRQAGFGGTDERVDFGVAGDVNNMLSDLRVAVTKAERELQLQQTTYREAAAQYDRNNDMYPCIPAIKPMAGYFSISGFGMRFHPVYHQMLFHEGLDIANAEGTPVHSTGDGVVIMAGHTSTGLGTMIVINHGYGYTTVYGHLSKVLVRAGAHVKRGATIALSGSTGIVTGPHLHYEVRLHGQLQNPVDHFFDNLGDSKSAGHGISSR